eukprot:4702353-Karenia_brevis.AAC.1
MMDDSARECRHTESTHLLSASPNVRHFLGGRTGLSQAGTSEDSFCLEISLSMTLAKAQVERQPKWDGLT